MISLKVIWTNHAVNMIDRDYLIMYEIKDVIWPNFKSPFLQPVRMGTSIYLVMQVKVVLTQCISITITLKIWADSTLGNTWKDI